jgi:hypothetical protein
MCGQELLDGHYAFMSGPAAICAVVVGSLFPGMVCRGAIGMVHSGLFFGSIFLSALAGFALSFVRTWHLELPWDRAAANAPDGVLHV